MCLIVGKEEFKIETAQEDIVCYKVLEKYSGYIISPYCKFLYEIGKEYKTIIEPRFIGFCYEIYKGFHSFLTLEDARDEMESLLCVAFRCFRCVIPKGSKIVYGIYEAKDVIVSEEIKIIEEV